MGFKEAAAKQGAVKGRGDLERALDWLCVNVKESELPQYVITW